MNQMTEEKIAFVTALLRKYESAYTKFQSLSPAVQKSYTQAYFEEKTYAGRKKRTVWLVKRLSKIS